MSVAKLEVSKLTGANEFTLWRIKMKALLVHQGLSDAISRGRLAMLQDLEAPRTREMLMKAHSAILLSLGDEVLREVADMETALEVWEKLEQLFLRKSLANRLLLKKQLYSLHMSEGTELKVHMDEFNRIIHDLKSVEVKIEEEDQALLLLSSLPKPYGGLVDTLVYGRESLDMNEVRAALNTKEIQRRADGKDLKSEVLVAKESRGRSRGKSKSKYSKYRSKSRGAAQDKRRCFNCNEVGHFKRDCPKRQGGKKFFKSDEGSSSMVAEREEEATSEVLCVSTSSCDDEWVLDSGCTFHMTPNKAWFSDLRKTNGFVMLGDGKTCKVEGIGSIKIKMADGTIKTLEEVRYLPEMKRNLVSLGTLVKRGFTIKMDIHGLKVMKESMVYMKGSMNNSQLYILKGKTIQGEVGVGIGNQPSSSTLWHLRLGHMSQKGLEVLSKSQMLMGDQIKQLEFCEECVVGKAHKVKFNLTSTQNSKGTLDYIHTDLWGPSKVQSKGGARYFMSIIDDYSRRVWVYFLKAKSEALGKFKAWQTLVENQVGRRVKSLRSDNGMEFCSKEFDLHCSNYGIKRHKTTPYTPQQNGVAERMNRTLLDKVRSMIASSGAAKEFWAEILHTAAYLVNRSPSSAIGFKTPMEKWSGCPPDLSNLRVFGCAAYAHHRDDKLGVRALRCVFIGYPDGTKGYKLWCVEDGHEKLIITRHVVFNESKFPWLKNQDQGKLMRDDFDDDDDIKIESDDEDHIMERKKATKLNSGARRSATFFDDDEGAGSDYFDASEQWHEVRVNAENEPPQRARRRTQAEIIQSREVNEVGKDSIAKTKGKRTFTPVERYGQSNLLAYAFNIDNLPCEGEPSCYEEALKSMEAHKWVEAMEEEMGSLLRNHTWELVKKEPAMKIIRCKWLYKLKQPSIKGGKPIYKARLVAKGFSQEEGVDYHEVFAPVVKHTTIRAMLSIANEFDLEIQQMDVRTAFLHGDLEEVIYMEQPPGFSSRMKKEEVCLLRRPLYGLKQSPRQWYKKFHAFMLSVGFERCFEDNCAYVIKGENHQVQMYLLLYVDDMLIVGKDLNHITKVKHQLNMAFEMKDLGEATMILGMEIWRDRKHRRLTLSQQAYMEKVLRRFNMEHCKPLSIPMDPGQHLSAEDCPISDEEKKEMANTPYANVVGSIMYAMISTRPDLAYSMSVLSRFMANPGRKHWKALQVVLRYIQGTLSHGLNYVGGRMEGEEHILAGYTDSDYAKCLDTRRSLSGYCFTLFGNCVSWKCNLQHVVALSTTEAEFMAATEAVKEALWLEGLIQEMGFKSKPALLYSDSQSAIHIMKNPSFHERSKHIHVRMHFIRQVIDRGDVLVFKINTHVNPADVFTKPLAKAKMESLLMLIGLEGSST